MKTNDSEINICMITDKNYIMPTCVAIKSILANKGSEKYNFYIITSNVPSDTEKEFNKFESEDTTVHIISDNAEKRFNGLHNFSGNSESTASIAALLKFVIPELLPDLDRVLYLDSDLIAEKDLGELYSTDIGDNYAAVVEEYSVMHRNDEYRTAVERYFNSGVMLLNLKKMRDKSISEVLTESKRNIYDASQVDKNILNMVFDGKIKTLPVKYNLCPTSIESASGEEINLKYGTDYKTKGEIISDAVIIHYSSSVKPWEEPCSALAYKWRHYYLSLYGNNSNANKEKYSISAVVTCRGEKKDIESTVESVLDQNFEDFEVIIIDCCASDEAKEAIHSYSEKYDNITYYELTGQSKESARNFGIQKAQGKYIHFIDSGDQPQKECWKTAYTFAQENDADLILFNAETEQEKSIKVIKNAFPNIYTGKEFFTVFHNSGAINTCAQMMLVKRELLTENGIIFPELGTSSDNFYIYKTVIEANCVMALSESLYEIGTIDNADNADGNEKDKIISLFNAILELTHDYTAENKTDEYDAAVFEYTRSLCEDLIRQYRAFEEKYGKEKCREELGDIQGAADVCMFIASSAQHSGLCKLTGEKYREINSKLQQTYKEKSEINAKLLQAYREKSEINAKLKKTYKEKSDKTKQIKKLQKYSLYPMLKKIKKVLTK